MRVSFVIPAHNEAGELTRTLGEIRRAAESAGLRDDFEIIVVDDASADGTGDAASACGARVVRVELRRISRVRNAGAAEARGDVLIFVDADTWISAGVVRAALDALAGGAIGGGAAVRWRTPTPLWGRFALWQWNLYARVAGTAAGCFMYARRAEFEAVGGFDGSFYCGEEIIFSRAMRARGRFVVLRTPVLTSPRKVERHSGLEILWLAVRHLAGGRGYWQRPAGKELWYARRDGR